MVTDAVLSQDLSQVSTSDSEEILDQYVVTGPVKGLIAIKYAWCFDFNVQSKTSKYVSLAHFIIWFLLSCDGLLAEPEHGVC